MTRANVFSFDGGGVRGVITATWIDMLEKKLNTPLVDHADLICGTSTGSIIALGVASGMAGEDIISLYYEKTPRIFPSFFTCTWSKIKRIPFQGFSSPMYSEEGLNSVLKESFGDSRLGDLPVPVLIPTYCLKQGHPLVLDSTKDEHKDIRCWEAARASSAAPTFFPAKILKISGENHILVDGGLSFNNPSILGADKLSQIQGGGFPSIFSFGTGEVKGITSEDFARNAGLLEWGTKLINVMLDANVSATDYYAQIMDYHYHRIQTTVAHFDYSIDNSRFANLKRLHNIAKNEQPRIFQIAKKIEQTNERQAR